jgi:plastocyanin
MRVSILLWLAWLAACGGDGSTDVDAARIDSPLRDAAVDVMPDAPSAVVRIACPTAPAATITTSNFMWMPPSVSIKVNEVVKVAPENLHRMVPHPSKASDPGMSSGATGEVRCLQFTTTGAFNYRCGPHPSMEGVVNVTN